VGRTLPDAGRGVTRQTRAGYSPKVALKKS